MKARAEEVNLKISGILAAALDGSEQRYWYEDKFIRWGLVEREIHIVVEAGLGVIADLELKGSQ